MRHGACREQQGEKGENKGPMGQDATSWDFTGASAHRRNGRARGASDAILLRETTLLLYRAAIRLAAIVPETTTASIPGPVEVPAPTNRRPGTGDLIRGCHWSGA